MEQEHLNPRPRRSEYVRDELRDETLQRDGSDRGWLWPAVALAAILIAGLLFFANMGDRTNTQVSEKAERPAPTTPNTTTPKTTPNNSAPTTTPKQP
jgi:hypothetical protein